MSLLDCGATAILTKLVDSVDAEELCSIVDVDQKAALLLLSLLLQAKMIFDIQDSEEENPTLLQWDFHDLLFHSRSRSGRTDVPFGGTYRFLGMIDPLPALKPSPTGSFISLFTPDLESIQKKDPPFGSVAEERKSERNYDEKNPITDTQLGEFLFRIGRTREMIHADNSLGRYEISSRPYPAGGACYELELYLTIHRCKHIDPGFYFYDSRKHRLYKISKPDQSTNALLRDAKKATGVKNPQVLITIAARFQRVSWKYEGIAYAMILKNVGVLYQTMYLTATAMGLAACGVGGGDSDLFCRIAGTDPYAESSVGEFLIGSKAPK